MHTHNDLLCPMEPSQLISEYAGFWDSKTSFFAEDDDLCSWIDFEDSGVSEHCNSSLLAPDDRAATPPAATLPKNIIIERERRRKFNKKPYDLRSVVPNITKRSQLISEYAGCWDSKTSFFAEDDDLCSWIDFEDSGVSEHCNSSLLAPDDRAATPPAATLPKNIIIERERRRKFNKKLYDLRSVVPNITKMNKASIVVDAIKYIEELQEEERLLAEEESAMAVELQEQRSTSPAPGKKRRTEWRPTSVEPAIVPSIEVMEVNVRELGNGTSAISIICSKKTNAIVRVCELVESLLHLRIIAVNISSVFRRIFYSIVVEVDGTQSTTCLKEQIEATLNCTS